MRTKWKGGGKTAAATVADTPDGTRRGALPLRESLDWLRDTLAPLYEEHAGRLLKDPWETCNDYIDVLLDKIP